jgi:hypothetical protein
MRLHPVRIAIRVSHLACVAVVTAGLTGGSLDAMAQDARVVSANSSNNQLLLIDFDGEPSVSALNFDANERKSLRGVVIRNDFADGVNLIVADEKAAEICWYADPVVHPATAGRCQLIGSPTLAPGPQLPSALALSSRGILFAGSSGTGNAASKMAEIWAYDRGPTCRRPGGYCEPKKVAGPLAVDITPAASTPTPVPLELLDELRVYGGAASGRIEPGDLLVLTSKPAALVILRGRGSDPFGEPLPLPDATVLDADDVLIYPADATGVDPSRKFPAGSPGGFAFAPGGRILVTTDTGTILSYGLDGVRQPDFVTGLDANGKFKIDVAQQRGVYRAFVADRNGGELLRFDVGTTGSGTLSGSVAQGVQFPVAVAVTNATVVPVAASNSPQTVDATGGTLKTIFRRVDEPGALGGTVYYLVGDPRNHAAGPSSFALNQVDASLPAITIPPYVRGLPCTGPEDPTECFVVVLQSTTAGYSQAIEVVSDPSGVLGWQPSCRLLQAPAFGDSYDELDRVFWGTVPEFGEPPILETEILGRPPTVINVTARCNSPSRGIVREASIFIAGRDTRPPDVQTSDGLAALGILLSGPDAQAIGKATLRDLNQLYERADRAFQRLRYTDTAQNLLAFADLAATVIGAPGRVGPELESRSRAAAFAVCSIPPAGTSLTCDGLTGAR